MKQIVGGTLGGDPAQLRTNFVSARSSGWYAELYRRDELKGGHVILLGPGNEAAAREALAAYPGGLQVGGGVNIENARGWLEQGASHVIVTSWVFPEGRLDWDRLRALGGHAVDVEGLCQGVDLELVEKLGEWALAPVTYAGGARSLADLEAVTRVGQGRIDLTIGSALDIFGGKGVRYEDAVAFNRGFRRPV